MTDPSAHAPPQTLRLLSAARPLEPVRSGKVVLPLSSGDKILPGKGVVRSKPQIPCLRADRLLVADPQKWRISSFWAGPRIGGWQVNGDHPALSDPGPGSIAQLPLFPIDDGVELEVEYVGSETDGEHFVACLCAEDNAQGRDLQGSHSQPGHRDTKPMSFLAESRPVLPGEQIRLALPARAYDIYVSDLTLRVADPTHWLVSDVLVGGDTLFVESGDLPGELLAERPGRAPLRLGRLRAREDLVVQAAYVGPLSSASLSYEVSGFAVPTSDAAADAAFLPMSSVEPIPCGAGATFRSSVGVPQGHAFLPEEVVLRDPDKWVVRGVEVGNVAQFACVGDVPGTLFGARTRRCQLNFSIAVPGGGVELVLHVRHIGPNTAGDPFICGVIGRVVRLPEARSSLLP